MNKIIRKKHLSANVVLLDIEAPLIARARKPGHFVIVRAAPNGERIPLTIAGADPTRGTITLVVQQVGVSSSKLISLNEGDYVTDLVGPLGKATHIEHYGTVLACGGGVGVAPLLPIVRGLKEAGNRVVSVIAARTKELIILEEEISAYSDKLVVMTDDGSSGGKGLITQGMAAVLAEEKVDFAVTIGPAVMMKSCAALTKEHSVPTVASLNAIMVDGTGMCGACRVTIGGKTRFTCIDGPEFDAHQIDYDELMLRLGGYRDIEAAARARAL